MPSPCPDTCWGTVRNSSQPWRKRCRNSAGAAQILIARYFHFQLVCGFVTVLQLLAEWLYLGKFPQRFQAGLLIGLCAAVLVGGYEFQPKLKALHATKYASNARPEIREAASRSFRAWHGV